MTKNPIDTADSVLGFQSLSTQAIALEPPQIDEAVNLSDRVVGETRQWQTYLNALALFSFEQWLDEHLADFPINQDHCSILQPQYANVIEAVCNLRVSEFNLCLIAIGSVTDTIVKLPRAVVDLPEFTAHFYVLLQILEQGQVQVWGFLRYDQLKAHQESVDLQAEPDWTYSLPATWFDRDPEHLLLYLRCSDPTAIPLPQVPANRLTVLANMEAELVARLPKLQRTDVQLWDVVTWEQGAAVLTSPELLDWLYQLQTQEAPSLIYRLKEVLQLLTQPAINVGYWFKGQLDEIAQHLSWVLLPDFTATVSPLLSTLDEIGIILTDVRRAGVTIPPQARSGYKNLTLDETPLRLYAVTWPLSSPDTVPEWSLLLILGMQSGDRLPHSTQLRVSDHTGMLLERDLAPNFDNSYLFARVTGTWQEKFLVTITSANGAQLTLPPFAFDPE